MRASSVPDVRSIDTFHMRREFDASLPPFPAGALLRIDDWLREVLRAASCTTDPHPAERASSPLPRRAPTPVPDGQARPGGESVSVERVAARWAALASCVMRAAGVPIFSDGTVSAPTGPAGRTSTGRVRVALPHVDAISSAAYAQALNASRALLHWMAARPRSDASVEALNARLVATIERLRRHVPASDSIAVLRAAHDRGVPFLHLGAGIYQLGWGSRAVRVDRSMTQRDTALGAKLATNKRWSATLMRNAGLPAPDHLRADSPAEAARAARTLGWPVVVKPVDGERGEGVTVGVADDRTLAEATKRALARSATRQALVERQVPGVCHRVFVAAGRLLYAVKRRPIGAIGDGARRVTELIDDANRRERALPPWLRKNPLPNDARAGAAMMAAGFTPASVPPAGVLVPLRDIESTEWGGVDEDVTGTMHADNVALAVRAARLFGLDTAGVDLITTDVTQPWHATGAIVNEVNYAPLLGGGEISRRHVPEFLARLVEGDGRIPIDAVVGDGEGWPRARALQRARLAEGLRCHVTSRDATIAPDGTPIRYRFAGLASRCRALLLDAEVDAIVLVVDDDEALRTGLPIDRVDSVTRAGADRPVRRDDGEPMTPAEIERLCRVLGGRGIVHDAPPD